MAVVSPVSVLTLSSEDDDAEISRERQAALGQRRGAESDRRGLTRAEVDGVQVRAGGQRVHAVADRVVGDVVDLRQAGAADGGGRAGGGVDGVERLRAEGTEGRDAEHRRRQSGQRGRAHGARGQRGNAQGREHGSLLLSPRQKRRDKLCR
jgi:hypothetical protein